MVVILFYTMLILYWIHVNSMKPDDATFTGWIQGKVDRQLELDSLLYQFSLQSMLDLHKSEKVCQRIKAIDGYWISSWSCWTKNPLIQQERVILCCGVWGVRSTFFKSLSVATKIAEAEGCSPSVHCQPPQKGPGRPWSCHIPETGAWAKGLC